CARMGDGVSEPQHRGNRQISGGLAARARLRASRWPGTRLARTTGTTMNDWVAPPRVLIVDDSAEQVGLLKRVLKADGCECDAISDGRRACEAALAIAPDAILLDVELPHLDGLSICRQLKNMPETALIPVLI